MKNKIFYRRKLPHWQPPEASFFITYRLFGSLPRASIEKLKGVYELIKSIPEDLPLSQKELMRLDLFEIFENGLENNLNEPHWLKFEKVAAIVMESLLFRNAEYYDLHAATIMSNHVHILITLKKGSPILSVILQNHKKFTAVQCNKVLTRNGKFWQEESFDTLIRNNDHFLNVVRYIINNPVKSGIVKYWKDYKWTYLDPKLEKSFPNL